MTKIKFCGLKTADDVNNVNKYSPDFAGFILCRRFFRFAEDFYSVRPLLDKKIPAVGVFVDDPYEYISEYVKKGGLDFVQLHGNEDEDFIKKIKDLGVSVIKAFKTVTPDDVERAFKSPADFVLLDSGTGTGVRFDWSLIRGFGRKYFLAGGLSPENVEKAIKDLSPYAVDVSSGIETDRKKDPEKMELFIKNARKQINNINK